MSEEERYTGEFKMKYEVGKNLLETYEVNGRKYTDNLPKNAFISIPKKQYIEYEQQKEKIERLNGIINEITIFIKYDYFKAREFKEKIQRSELCQGDYPIAYYHADWLEDITDVYLNKLQELKGSDKVE